MTCANILGIMYLAHWSSRNWWKQIAILKVLKDFQLKCSTAIYCGCKWEQILCILFWFSWEFYVAIDFPEAFKSKDPPDSALESCVKRPLPPSLRSYCTHCWLQPSTRQRRTWKHQLDKSSEIQHSHLATAKNKESTSLKKYLIPFYLLWTEEIKV